ncbi:uncharacterized protein J3D65DRAFT_605960 [Phyllosticta citribraziliensis]|uniref:Proteophosphoglycan ppg4 n=1 Tax=Phyllosticta citribraziliensis TaxID=989973 RepID=A0ABR1L9Q7_9PEZI
MSFHEKIPGSFPVSRSATPSPSKQPAPKAPGLDAPPVPDLPIPAETHMEQGGHDDEEDYFSDEEGFESSQPAAFHAPEQTLTALPSMDKSPEKRASQDSGVNLDKSLPPPPQPKRLFGFLREKHAAARADAATTSTTTTDATTSRGRRVMTSVGGGLRALRLLTRSHADLRKESSRSTASSLHLPVSVPAGQSLGASRSVSPAPSSTASARFLQFPLPPGYKAENPEEMRVRASLEEELESVRAAVEEEDPPVLDPVGPFGRSGLALPRTRGRQEQQQQQPDLDAHSRSPSTETVIRHPRVSSTETLVRAARRASIPARLPLSPVILGQPVVAARPSPAAGVFAAADTIAMSAAANACRIRRQGSRNFSRPFAVQRQGAVGGSGEEEKSEVVEAEREAVGLAISMGPSPVKPLQRQQSASLTGDCASPFDDAPADWPLRKTSSSSVGSAALDKPLPALPEEDGE